MMTTVIITIVMEIIMMLIISNVNMDISSFIAGIMSSAIVWWIINKFTTPRLSLSQKIVRNRKSPDSYLIKIQNKSHLRGVYNVIIHTVYCTANESYHREELTTVAYLKHKPWFHKKEKVEQKEKPYEMKIRIMGPKKNSQEYVPLEMFLEEKSSPKSQNKAFLDIIIICYDRYSGTAKQIITNRYFTQDVLDDVHFEEGSVDVVANDNNENGVQS